ncbi:hypothetical protein [Poseidonibacter lekithochrous]|uniref:hypothetical protein n=1 Tax=Poseidonibacter lekithochrous TaxID=1904463 RepID=UPI0008FCD90C|nr:hypothetical protein [Poseidonibacter lekithochrous]QKJ21417.1 hypothetical protein ALEK_0096 [Poseidonibacter lekithochrous]
MSLLQYTSKEMFSSTELIRKSKNVFDKLAKDEIEKAIILRDGKPSFMLLDFNKYEDIMTEYLAMKAELENKTTNKQVVEKVEEKAIEKKIETKEEEIGETEDINIVANDIESVEEISDLDLQDALAKIEELGNEINIENVESPQTNEKKVEIDSSQNIKEFWD